MTSNAIIGAWKLVSFEFRKDNGSVIYPFGAEARGSVIYTESGRFSGQLMRINRPKFAIPDQMQGTPEEIEANYKGSISYFGTYEIDTDKGEVNHFVEGSIFPNMEGTKQKRFYELSENQLLLKTPPFKVGGERAVGIITWKRVE
jgi:hypothetical protein